MSQTLTSLLTSQGKLSTEVQDLQVYLGIALDNMPHGLSMYDGRQRLIVANKAYRELYALPDILTRPGTSLAHVIRHYVKSATGHEEQEAVSRQLEWVRQEVAALSTGKLQVRTQTLHGGARVRVTTQPLPKGGWVDVHEDVTKQDAHEEELKQRANYDEQTGLLNRRGLEEQLAQLFVQPSPSNLVLHLIHLGNGHVILNAHGFAVREGLVRELGRVMNEYAAPIGAARISGDYFAIAQKFNDTREVRDFSSQLKSKLPQTMTISGHQLALDLSVMHALIQSELVDLDQIVDWVARERVTTESAPANVLAFKQA
jgi:GGDEF domain-containing protein